MALFGGEQALFAVGFVGREVLEVVVVGEILRIAEQGVQPLDQCLFADRRQARRRRRHQLRVLQRVVDLLDVRPRECAGDRAGFETRILDDLAGDVRRYPRELVGQEVGDGDLAGVFHHALQCAEFDAVRMRLDLDRLLRHFVDDAWAVLDFRRRRLRLRGRLVELEDDACVRVREPRLLQVRLDTVTARFVLAEQQDLDARTRGLGLPVVVVLERIALDARCVLRGIDEQAQLVGLAARLLADDGGRLPGRHLAVHDGGRNADALLPTRLFEAMEFRAVQQLREDLADLGLWNPRSVVLDAHQESRSLAERRRLKLGQLDEHFRKNPRLFTSVQCVVDGLTDRRQQRLLRRIEAKQMAVFREELADGNLSLTRDPRRLCSGAVVGIGVGGRTSFLLRRHGSAHITLLITAPAMDVLGLFASTV